MMDVKPQQKTGNLKRNSGKNKRNTRKQGTKQKASSLPPVSCEPAPEQLRASTEGQFYANTAKYSAEQEDALYKLETNYRQVWLISINCSHFLLSHPSPLPSPTF